MANWSRRILATAALALAPVLLVAGTAEAASNSGAYGSSFVDGGGGLTDDWDENFDELGNSLCSGCADSSGTDLVVLWQTILFAENLAPASAIDGYFGSKTASATVSWQKLHGLTGDGKVGDATWRYAGDRLDWWVVGGVTYVEYDAKNGSGQVLFVRGSSSVSKDGGAYRLRTAKEGGTTVEFGNSSSTARIRFYSRTIVKM